MLGNRGAHALAPLAWGPVPLRPSLGGRSEEEMPVAIPGRGWRGGCVWLENCPSELNGPVSDRGVHVCPDRCAATGRGGRGATGCAPREAGRAGGKDVLRVLLTAGGGGRCPGLSLVSVSRSTRCDCVWLEDLKMGAVPSGGAWLALLGSLDISSGHGASPRAPGLKTRPAGACPVRGASWPCHGVQRIRRLCLVTVTPERVNLHA